MRKFHYQNDDDLKYNRPAFLKILFGEDIISYHGLKFFKNCSKDFC